VGAERATSAGFIQIKVANPNQWRMKHQVVWETAHGPLPNTHALYFADGDKFNISLDNLVPFPKNGRMTAELFQILPGSGPASGSPAVLVDRLRQQTEAIAARVALGIQGMLFSQLESLQTSDEDDHVSYRH